MKKSERLIVEDIREVLASFAPSDDVMQRFDYDVVRAKVSDIRLTLLADDFGQRKKLLEGWYTRSCCHEVLCRSVGCATGVLADVPALMKEYYIDLNDVNLIRDLPGSIKFIQLMTAKPIVIPYMEYEMFLYQSGSAYSRSMSVFTVVNDSDAGQIAPIKNMPTEAFKYACLYAIHADPSPICEYDEDSEYPIPGILIHKLEYLVIKHFMAGMGIQQDIINDANDLRQFQQNKQQEQQ